MQNRLALFALIVFLTGCQMNLQAPRVTATARVLESTLTTGSPDWSIYDPDPEHLWNRVFRQLYERRAANGEVYGAEELDPLLWFDTMYLLAGDSHQKALQVLDDFLASDAERLIQDPLKRAMFQRDLWAVFDWAASQAEPYPVEREALQVRLAEIIRQVALPRNEILSLPDNYALAVASGAFPSAFQANHPETAFLPSGLFQPESAWMPMGRVGGPVAITHTEAAPFFGRSAFLVLVRSPDGRNATLDFIHSLNTESNPVTHTGTEVALVRQMLLIDNQGQLVASPLVETIQIRHFSPVQSFYEFELNRRHLFAGMAGGLVLKHDLFLLFMSHGDIFEAAERPHLRAIIPDICKACHAADFQISDSGNTKAIISYSREPFALPDNGEPLLFPTTSEKESATVIEWKRAHPTWKSLEGLWQ